MIECVSLAATEMLNQGAPPVPKVNTEHCRACTYLVAPLSYALLCILVWRWVRFQVRKWGGKRQQARFPWKPVIACEVGGTEKLKRLWEVARVIFLIASAVAQANDFP